MVGNGKVLVATRPFLDEQSDNVSSDDFTDYYFRNESGELRVVRIDSDGEELFDDLSAANSNPSVYAFEKAIKTCKIDWMNGEDSPVAEKMGL